MYQDAKYKAYSAAYPSSDIDPTQKNEQWHRQYAISLYANYVQGLTAIQVEEHEQIRVNRQYGAGRQSAEGYKDALLGRLDLNKNGQLEGRKSWANIDFNKIISVAPKFRRIIIGMFETQEHKVECNAVSEQAQVDKEDQKWKLWAEEDQKDFIQLIDKITGAKPKPKTYEPKTLEELELFDSMGGFKLQVEVAMEPALDFIHHFSGWPEIKSEMIGDAIDTGKMMCKDFTDPVTQKVGVRYVDPENSIYVLDENKGVSKFAELRYYSIENLRKELPHLKDEEINTLAVSFRNYCGNEQRLTNNIVDEKTGLKRYDDYIIPVLECEFGDTDVEYKTERKAKDGGTMVYTEPYKNGTPKVYNTETRKTNAIRIKVFRRAKWIVGSDICWDYGMQYDVPRPDKCDPKSSYHVKIMPGLPIMQQIIPNLDQIQLANLKIQNALAMAPGAGIAYEFSSLQGMTIGGKGMDPMDIIKMHRQASSFVYKATTHRGGMISPMAGKPFQELPGGIGQLLGELITIINMNLEQIRDVTGVNQVTDASSPESKQGLGVSQLAVSATTNSLKPIYSTYIKIYEECFANCTTRVLMSAKYNSGKVWVYEKSIGKTAQQVLKQGAEYGFEAMGIKVHALPTQKEIMDIEQQLQIAMTAGRNGQPAITMSEAFAVKRMINSGASLKYAEMFLAYRDQKNKEYDEKMQQENMAINAKNAQETETLKAKLLEEAAQKEHEREKDLKTHEANEEIRVARETLPIELQLLEKKSTQPAMAE